MTKKDLIATVAGSTGQSKSAAEAAINAVIGSITDALSKGDDVTLVGFGTFTTVNKAAREGRNPKTGEKLKIPASTAPKFKPGKALKDAVSK
ncbi:MAG: DNA-binding protein HU [Candidatus Lambdaproteobacteria bacterium RIFOXYD12_FULL_49_8]|uniref:DNA-binding protein HU n=1 Tax=Candidatus Lambdaproteobacteria bacterium RIFOXYD2_FULL_50_16 TaxID=1817772 RepID=A0A1F6GBG4_9PROT|nr:MAG: DNA-binding protein HU [Candidatus Lambdaproteobacteria bacterium RIFOXYD2_FULL_50_16]OGG97903.1 MAG: DNA-binding protein HU [Candidatus Lambdaproteobacteria bacterium RIFOXYD12_FULL_49_8]